MKSVVAFVILSVVLGQSAPPRFRAGVDVVTVDALVTIGARAVMGLTAGDFELRDSGVVQDIDSVSIDEAPVSMMLALDTSNSVEGLTLHHLKEAATAAVDSLGRNDRAAVLTFAEAVALRSGWGAPPAAMRTAIAGADAGGSTSLYDAAYSAMTMEDDLPGRRSFVLLFSDGGDSASWLPANAMLERARRSDAVVYLVTLRPPRPDVRLEYRSGIDLWGPAGGSPAGVPAIVELTNMTGGQALIAERPERLRDTFSAIVTQFRNRYLLTYRPRGVDATGWHPIELKIKGRHVEVRARRGYSK